MRRFEAVLALPRARLALVAFATVVIAAGCTRPAIDAPPPATTAEISSHGVDRGAARRGSFRIVRELPRGGPAYGARHWRVLRFAEGSPVLYSDGEVFDLSSSGPRWRWSGAPLRRGPVVTGARKLALVVGEEPAAELVIADADSGEIVGRHDLGVATSLWLGAHEARKRVASGRPVVETSFDGRTRTLTDYEEPSVIEARAPVDSSIPAAARSARWTAAERVYPSDPGAGAAVVVSALACLDRGERLRGRILVFDRAGARMAEVTVPAWHYEIVEQREGSLLLLASGHERICEPSAWATSRSIGEAKLVEVVYDPAR